MADEHQNVIPILFGIIIVEWGAGKFAQAEATATDILERAARVGDTGARVAGDFAVAATRLQSGDFLHARRHLESAITLYRSVDAATAFGFIQDYTIELGAFSHVYAGWCWWLLGYPDQARDFAAEALAISDRVRHDYSRSRALYCKSVMHAFRREWTLVAESAQASITVARERGFAMMVAVSRIMLTAAQALRNPSAGAIDELRQAIASYRATGTKLQSTQHLALLAQALAAADRAPEGRAALDEALALADETGERYVEAEIHRLRGETLHAEGHIADAEAGYAKALGVARTQQARTFELRAATSLARIRAEQGRRAEATALLAPVYNWFTEGFDTADLKDAKALLDELA